eukprot:3330841-Amphidinium_carterae.1
MISAVMPDASSPAMSFRAVRRAVSAFAKRSFSMSFTYMFLASVTNSFSAGSGVKRPSDTDECLRAARMCNWISSSAPDT